MLESITGLITSVENATGIAAGDPALNTTFWIILAVLIGWAVLLGLAYLVLAIISCVRQKFPLTDLLSRSFASFKALYKPMLKYYIPLMILSFIVGIYNLLSNLLTLLADAMPNSNAISFIILMVFLPFILASAIYTGVLDSSLAKSYYNSLKTRKFAFGWISFGEFIKLLGVGILYSLMLLASFFLLGIPLLFLPAISLFLRFPLLNEGKGIGETIGKSIDMLKKDFWNVFFFYFIYSLLVGFVSGLIQIVPVVGYVAVMVIIVPISTLLSAEAYYYLNKNYEKVAKKAR